jgi:hypothetical protein
MRKFEILNRITEFSTHLKNPRFIAANAVKLRKIVAQLITPQNTP